jgi:hypothetical protein
MCEYDRARRTGRLGRTVVVATRADNQRRRCERQAASPAVNPALLKHADQRRQHLENRIADQITRFAGSMLFVYLQITGSRPGSCSGSSTTPMGC